MRLSWLPILLLVAPASAAPAKRGFLVQRAPDAVSAAQPSQARVELAGGALVRLHAHLP